jgi:hypothetical protein
MSADLKELCQERAASYGALRGSSLTAIALDRARARIEQLERQLAEAREALKNFLASADAGYVSVEVDRAARAVVSAPSGIQEG